MPGDRVISGQGDRSLEILRGGRRRIYCRIKRREAGRQPSGCDEDGKPLANRHWTTVKFARAAGTTLRRLELSRRSVSND
jgi:hypothetical protein